MASSFRDLQREAPAFTTYFTTAVMARLASEGLRLALILAAAATPAGIKLGGLLVAAFLIPSIVSAPFVGRMADMSRNPTRLYSLAFAFNGLMIALCAVLIGRAPSALVLVLAAIGGSVGPLMMGGLSSLVGTIVPKPLLHRGYALDVVTYNVSAILAPAIVAAIAGWITPLASLLTLAVLMLVASVNVLRLPINRAHDRAVIAPPAPADGFKAIGRIPPLRSTVVASSLGSMAVGIVPIAATLFAIDTFSVNAGVLLSTMAIGALVGSLTFAARPFGLDLPHIMFARVSGLTAIPMVIITFISSTPLALACFAFQGLLGGPQGTAQFAVRDQFSPPNVRTQVFTLSTSLKTTFSALGAALAGLLSGASPQTLMLIAAGFAALGSVLALVDLWSTGWLKPKADSEPAIKA